MSEHTYTFPTVVEVRGGPHLLDGRLAGIRAARPALLSASLIEVPTQRAPMAATDGMR